MYSIKTVLLTSVQRQYNIKSTTIQPQYSTFFFKDLSIISQSGLVGLTISTALGNILNFLFGVLPSSKTYFCYGIVWLVLPCLLCKSTKYILSFSLNINETANALYILICYHILCLHFNMYSCSWSISLLSIIIDVIGFFSSLLHCFHCFSSFHHHPCQVHISGLHLLQGVFHALYYWTSSEHFLESKDQNI